MDWSTYTIAGTAFGGRAGDHMREEGEGTEAAAVTTKLCACILDGGMEDGNCKC